MGGMRNWQCLPLTEENLPEPLRKVVDDAHKEKDKVKRVSPVVPKAKSPAVNFSSQGNKQLGSPLKVDPISLLPVGLTPSAPLKVGLVTPEGAPQLAEGQDV